MKIRTSIFCFFLIFACAGILLSRLDSLAVSDTALVRGTMEESEKGGNTRDGDDEIPEDNGEKKTWTIILDPGHGGNDPGKIGVNDVLEKDINLNIALYLQEYLIGEGIQVIMTRTTDTGLYSEDASNKKAEDMKNRVALIGENDADLLVSIHQNSYTQEQYAGAQVFYYTGSQEGQLLACCVQESLISGADPQNHRQAKENSDYYLLKKSSVPAIICECGFLSNREECEKLSTPEYQKRIAQSISQGICQYIQDSDR